MKPIKFSELENGRWFRYGDHPDKTPYRKECDDLVSSNKDSTLWHVSPDRIVIPLRHIEKWVDDDGTLDLIEAVNEAGVGGEITYKADGVDYLRHISPAALGITNVRYKVVKKECDK